MHDVTSGPLAQEIELGLTELPERKAVVHPDSATPCGERLK